MITDDWLPWVGRVYCILLTISFLFLRARSTSFCSRVVRVIRRREWRKQIKPLRRGAECNKLVDFSNYCYWRDMASIGWLSFCFYYYYRQQTFESRVSYFGFLAFFAAPPPKCEIFVFSHFCPLPSSPVFSLLSRPLIIFFIKFVLLLS